MDALEVLINIQQLDIKAIAEDNIYDVTEIIADLNADQLAHGIRADGSPTTPSYKDSTIAYKRGRPGLSGVTDRVTLYDTGAFYAGLYAAVQGEDITFGSHDEKEAKLEKKYSRANGPQQIFGLTEDSKEELINSHLQTAWEEAIEKITGLDFE